jgi:hypothetical protein
MEDKQFDQIMKSKLEQGNTPLAPGAWHQFAEKLDARAFDPSAPTTPIDELAKRHLTTPREVPYVAAHWEQLAGHMDRVRTLVVRLRTAKIAEAAIILLTLLNLDAFAPKSEWQKPAEQKKSEPIVQLNQKMEQNAAPFTQPNTQSATHSTLVDSQLSNIAETESGQKHAANQQAQVINNTSFVVTPEFAVSSNQTTLAAETSQNENNTAQNSNIATSAEAIVSVNTIVRAVPFISTLQPDLLSGVERSLAFQAPMIKPSANATSVHFYIYAGPDFVGVNGTNQTQTIGHTSGVQVSARKGKWGVASGVEYSKLSYKTTPTKEILAGNLNQGFVGRTLRSLDFEIVQVPVRITRKLYKRKGTEMLATAGVQAMATVQISPDYNAFYIPGSTPDIKPVVPPNLPFVPASKGLFEGGNAANNLHAVAQAGLRLEQRIGTSNKLLFVEINGQSLLTRRNLGPAEDSFAGLGLRTGIMAAL